MILAATMLLATNSLVAYNFRRGGIYYNITSNVPPYSVEVTSGGLRSYSGNVVIPDSVFYNGNFYAVVAINSYTFDGCVDLTSITIPGTVTRIGQLAFGDCHNLRKTNFTGTIAQWCKIAFGVSGNPILRSHNFYLNDTIVTNLIIPNSVDSISSDAFRYDTAITTLTIGDSVVGIGNRSFRDCLGLTHINFGISVEHIGNGAFSRCISLASLNLPYSATNIDEYAFAGCSSLTSINIPNSINRIGTGVFGGCSKLTSISIPHSVMYIELDAFSNDSSLSSITFHRANTFIDSNGFRNGVPTNIPVYVPCGSTTWYMNELPNFTSFSEFMAYNYSAISQDSTMGFITIDTLPTCINNVAWTITATANIGYLFSHWSDGDSNAHRTLTLIQDTALIAHFRWYNFVVVTEDTNKGSVQIITTPTKLNPQAFISAQPKTGYTFLRWSDGDTTNPRIITVTQDTILTAYFSPNTYNVIVLSNDTTKGSVSGSGRFAYMTQDTIVATSNYGYSFSHWSDGDTTNPRIITITQDTNFTAFYNFNYYNVAVLSNDTTKGSVSGSGRFAYMTQDTIVATANYGYSFSHWSDGDTTNPRIIIVTQDTNLTAFYNFNYYNVVVSSDDTTKGSVSGSGRFAYLSQDTLIATPISGYTFSRWSDGDTMNPRVITIMQDTAIIAYFTQTIPQPWYNFVVVSEDTNKGTVQIVTQPTQASPQALIVALPKTGYSFSRWSDGNTQNPRTLTVTQDTILIAFFTSNQGIAEAENENVTIRTAKGHILLEGIGNEFVYVTDVFGRVVYNATVNERAEIAVRNCGVYFVKVGNHSAQKVVVVR